MSIKEQLMNLDLKKAYEESIRLRWTEKVDRKSGQKKWTEKVDRKPAMPFWI